MSGRGSDWRERVSWRLAVRGAGGAEEVAPTADPTVRRATDGGETREWAQPFHGGALAVTISGRPEDNGLWTLNLDVRLPEGFHVERADFPLISDLTVAEDARLAVPTGWGIAPEVKPGFRLDVAYPSCRACMGFVALCDGGNAFYLAAHDPEAHYKSFRAEARQSGITMWCSHWTEIPSSVPQPPAGTGAHGAFEGAVLAPSGAFRLPYAMTVGEISGGWYEAAQVYRAFALSAPWARAPLAERGIPEWLLKTDLWLKPGETPWTDDDAECRRVTFENVETCIRARDYFGVPIALHWYRWHQIPYDTLYPEYFPPKAGFVDGVKAARKAGLPVMPYINGRLCDPNSATWKNGGSEWAARDDDGKPYTEVYGSGVPLNVMCPSTKGWRDTVTALVDRLFREVGVDGVYIDQIGAAAPYRCLRTDHGHVPGGGAAWARGYRGLMEQARARVPEGGILTTEENAEPWMDQFDGYLVVNTPTNEGEVIPLFPAVYAGRCVTFGFQYIPASEAVHSPAFRAKMARAFLWGAQPGWVDAARLMAPEARDEAGFVRALCHARAGAHDFLQYGQFLGSVEVSGENPRLRDPEAPGSFGGTYVLDVPAVMATAWRADDGRLGVAVCNMDDVTHTVTLAAPRGAAGSARLELPARSARVIPWPPES